MVGKYDEQDAARAQRAFGVLDDVPGFGHVEDHAVEFHLVDAVGDVTNLDAVVDVLSQEVVDVLDARVERSPRVSRTP